MPYFICIPDDPHNNTFTFYSPFPHFLYAYISAPRRRGYVLYKQCPKHLTGPKSIVLGAKIHRTGGRNPTYRVIMYHNAPAAIKMITFISPRWCRTFANYISIYQDNGTIEYLPLSHIASIICLAATYILFTLKAGCPLVTLYNTLGFLENSSVSLTQYNKYHDRRHLDLTVLYLTH